MAVPQFTALASKGGLTRLLAALRTWGEPLTRPRPISWLECGREAQTKLPISQPSPHSGELEAAYPQ